MSIKSSPYFDLNQIASGEAEIFIKSAQDQEFIKRAGYFWSMAKRFNLTNIYYQKALMLVRETNFSIHRVCDLFNHCYSQLEKFPLEVYYPTYQKLSLEKDQRFKKYFEKTFPQVSMIDIL